MKICYLNITREIPQRDVVYINGLKENGVEVIEILDNSPKLKKFWHIFKKHRALNNNYDILWVGYSAHILAPFARLISRKKIVFNALCSLYEGLIISRKQAPRFSPKAFLVWLQDFLSFHCSSLILVESEEQKKFLIKKFFLKEKKLQKAWTGVNDRDFFYNPAIKKSPVFSIIFRGGFLPESGIEHVAEAASLLQDENIRFRIIGTGVMEDALINKLATFNSKNVEFISEKIKRVSRPELNIKMQECHISLGQLSDHDRLNRTIPHKAFESMVMKIPYLTARNKAVLELFAENETCFCCNPADSRDLADKIIWIKNNYETAQKIAENAYQLYSRELTPKILAKKVLELF
ncbi:MAG: glycosyltransferase [Candidatus Yanofskybacteria bacterium]|nr:glycosyltransferase [Candidatus Yanofskybacteria bacterium]